MLTEMIASETKLCNHHHFKIFSNQEMISQAITSLQHPFVKYCVKLRTDKAFRQKERKVLICGSKLITELSTYVPLKFLLETDAHINCAKADKTYIVSEEIIKKISGMQAPEPVCGVIEMPEKKDLSGSNYLLILDGIADPGNLGTLLRSALALGWDGVFLLNNTCDPFNDKALRAAKGATFHIPIQSGSWDDLQQILGKKKFQVLSADLKGTPYNKISCSHPLALVLGSESHGTSNLVKKSFESVSIPMPGPMESLNVAIAGAILLAHLRGCP